MAQDAVDPQWTRSAALLLTKIRRSVIGGGKVNSPYLTIEQAAGYLGRYPELSVRLKPAAGINRYRIYRHGGRSNNHWRLLGRSSAEHDAWDIFEFAKDRMRQGGLALVGPEGTLLQVHALSRVESAPAVGESGNPHAS